MYFVKWYNRKHDFTQSKWFGVIAMALIQSQLIILIEIVLSIFVYEESIETPPYFEYAVFIFALILLNYFIFYRLNISEEDIKWENNRVKYLIFRYSIYTFFIILLVFVLISRKNVQNKKNLPPQYNTTIPFEIFPPKN